jgi:hypothetical protein
MLGSEKDGRQGCVAQHGVEMRNKLILAIVSGDVVLVAE